MKKEDKILNEVIIINKKFEVVIALLLRMLPKDRKGLLLREQIALLNNLGIGPTGIAKIINRFPKYVSKELAEMRKAKKKKKHEKEN